MKNYLVMGPVRIRISTRHLAPWGYARLVIGGLDLLSRTNDGHLVLASYHPSWSHTWRWSAQVFKGTAGKRWINRSQHRRGQWHDYYRLPFGWQMMISQQNYMPKRAPVSNDWLREKTAADPDLDSEARNDRPAPLA